MKRAAQGFVLASLVFLTANTMWAQSASCPAIVVPQPKPADNIFTEEQENEFGDIMAEQVQREFGVIEDDALAQRLRVVAAKVQAQLPPTQIRLRFMLIDEPYVDAFSSPGGRIYVSRKLIAFAKNEDELAGVLGHEMGHVYTHQIARDLSKTLRSIGITQLGDEADVRAKYEQLEDSKKAKFGQNEDKEQGDADFVGLQAAARAGYDPQALANFIDRLAQLHGNTGNWLSNMFGMTSRDSKRLRALINEAKATPSGCMTQRTVDAAAFQKWQHDVAAFSGRGRTEHVSGVLHQARLHPTLVPDFAQVRFSPDGKYLLAQDDAGVAVFSREPLQQLFYINAEEAQPAAFSPDSKRISWMDDDLHVEWWDVATQTQAGAYEIALPPERVCLTSALAPDGNTAVCWDQDGKILLIDVATDEIRYDKKFSEPIQYSVFDPFLALRQFFIFTFSPPHADLAFSTDARYVLVHHRFDTAAFDLTTRQPVEVAHAVKPLVNESFTFLDGNRLVGVNRDSPQKSAVVHFPDGAVVGPPLMLGHQRIEPTTHGNYLQLLPIREHALGLIDVTTGKIPLAGDARAVDVYDDTVATELDSGDVALLQLSPVHTVARVPASTPLLGRISNMALSDDFRWLALSSRVRSGIWDLQTGERLIEPRGFRSAGFAANGALYCEFPKDKELPHVISPFSFASKQFGNGRMAPEAFSGISGPALFVFTPPADKDKKGTAQLESRDLVTDAQLWSRQFDEMGMWKVDPASSRIIITYSEFMNAAKQQQKKQPPPKTLGSWLAWEKILDAKTGKDVGELWTYAGDFRHAINLEGMHTDGDLLVRPAAHNRIVLYSLNGQVKAKFFGHSAILSAASRRLAIENEDGHVGLFDVDSTKMLTEYVFKYPVSYMQFDHSGTKLFVLTKDQLAYTIDVAQVGKVATK